MTLSIRIPATLLRAATQAPLASGIAVIWADPEGWGGIFEATEQAETLRATVAAQPLAALLQTADGREAAVTLGLSEFVADGVRPLILQGEGAFDTVLATPRDTPA